MVSLTEGRCRYRADRFYKKECLMGKINNAICDYLRDKRRFSDCFNGLLFGGAQEVDPRLLKDGSEKYDQPIAENPGTQERGGAVERIRDIKMVYDDSVCLRILGLEAESKTDLTLALRAPEYDIMEYRRQVRELQEGHKEAGADVRISGGLLPEDRLSPVYTIWLYVGDGPYTGPRSLKDMMRFPDNDPFRKYFSDYRPILVCLNELEDMDVFHTEVRPLFKAMKYRGDYKGLRKLMSDDPAYRSMDADTLHTLSIVIDRPGLWKNRDRYMERKEEAEMYNAELAWKEWEEAVGEQYEVRGMVVSDYRHNDNIADISSRYNIPIEEVESILEEKGLLQPV